MTTTDIIDRKLKRSAKKFYEAAKAEGFTLTEVAEFSYKVSLVFERELTPTDDPHRFTAPDLATRCERLASALDDVEAVLEFHRT